jgi:hypothetical protein
MASASKAISVYIETGKERVFAVAIDWPGWCRSARTEAAALENLLAYGARYAKVMRLGRVDFDAPAGLASLAVRDHVKGTTTTDFGSPDVSLKVDQEPLPEKELIRYQSILQASWKTFDRWVATASGAPLRKGPRGGGRELEEIVAHLAEAEVVYLGRMDCKLDPVTSKDDHARRAMVLEAMRAGASGGIPQPGPRGGKRWNARYFVRRVAWHILDHAWEIEDRVAA